MNINVPILDKGYKVLVKCPTYNHSKFICDALNGFSIQETNFPFICIVVDDASKDGNQDVIKQYANENCDMSNAEISEDDISTYIRVSHKTNSNCDFLFCLLKVNLYGKPEKQEIYKPYRAVCEYEASCEGDDYWILPSKLQKQVDILVNNLNVGAVYTQFYGCKENTKSLYDRNVKIKNGQQYETMLLGQLDIWTLTICYRVDILRFVPNLDSHIFFRGDINLFLSITSRYEVVCIPEKTAVYRELKESASHFTNRNAAVAFRYKAQNTFNYHLENGPKVSKKVYDNVKYRLAQSTISYAYSENRYELLKKVKYPLNYLNSCRNLFSFVLLIIGRNQYLFNFLRLCLSQFKMI